MYCCRMVHSEGRHNPEPLPRQLTTFPPSLYQPQPHTISPTNGKNLCSTTDGINVTVVIPMDYSVTIPHETDKKNPHLRLDDSHPHSIT